MIVVTDMTGQPISAVSHPCGLYETIQKIPDAFQKCLHDWGRLAGIIDLEPKFVPNHIGLLGTRGLIRVGSELKGMVMIGGIAPENWPPSPEATDMIAAELGLTAAQLRPHLTEVFYLDLAQQSLILAQTQRLANILAHIAAEHATLMGKLDSIAKLIAS
jgi:hypothetical protein